MVRYLHSGSGLEKILIRNRMAMQVVLVRAFLQFWRNILMRGGLAIIFRDSPYLSWFELSNSGLHINGPY